MLSDLFFRLRAIVTRQSMEEELDEELRAHIEHETAKLVASGLSHENASRAARLAIGGLDQVKEDCRDARGISWWDRTAADLKYSLRGLLNSPVFTLTAIVIFGVGIGVDTTIFSIVNRVLLHPLPFPSSQEIVHVRRRTDFGSSSSFSMHDYLAIRAQKTALSALAIADGGIGGYNLISGGMPEQVSGMRVSAQYFLVFGVRPVAGRLFADGDDAPGQPRFAVISEGLWTRRFGRNPSIVGASLNVGGEVYNVAGVVPDEMRGFMPSDVYFCLPIPSASIDRTNGFQVVGRLKPGLTLVRAEAEIDTIARHHAENSSLTNMPQGILLREIQEEIAGRARPALKVLFAAVALVLLIACSNVANLILARGAGRRREIAVMAALGAPRSRVVSRLLTEGILLAGAGGALGLLLAYFGVRALPALSADRLPQIDQVQVDLAALGFAFAAAVVCGLLASIAPTLDLAKTNLTDALKQATAQGGATRGGNRLRNTLVTFQIALSTVLLMGAILLVRTFSNLSAVDPGFRADHLLTMNISVDSVRYPDSVRAAAYYERVVETVERVPGVVAASSVTTLPFEPVFDFPVRPLGGDPDRVGGGRANRNQVDAWYRAINRRFFTAMGISLLRGRVFDESDSANSAPVVIVNNALAQKAFPDQDALGKSLVIGEGYLTEPRELRPRTVIGVVGDTREEGLTYAPPGVIFVPVSQSPDRITRITLGKIPTRWVIRTTGDPLELTASVRRAVLEVDATQPPAEFQTMERVLARSFAPARFNMLMLAIFAFLALALAALGVYGLMSYSVSVRVREIGLRMSLGAQPADVVRSLVWQGLVLCCWGVFLGLVSAMALGRFLRNLLFGIPPSDVLTIAAVVGTWLIVMLVSNLVPASRAATIDPMRALREE